MSDYREIEAFLPPTEGRFKVLMTTRHQWLGQSFQRLELEVLKETAALERFTDESYLHIYKLKYYTKCDRLRLSLKLW